MCGPACLKIVLAYFGMQVSVRRLEHLCRASRVSGTTGTNLVHAARRLGFEADIVDNASLPQVSCWLRRGVPVIVDWMSTVPCAPGRHAQACGHYSVVAGLDRRFISLQDPAIGGRRRVTRRGFLNVWSTSSM